MNETLKVEEQHPDTLAAFLAERQLTEADVLAALETRQNTRTEAIAKIVFTAKVARQDQIEQALEL